MLFREKQSVKAPFFHIDNLTNKEDFTFESDSSVYRLFRMNRLMNHLHLKQAIPYMFKSFAQITDFTYDDLRNKFINLEHREGMYLKLRLEKQKPDQFFILHQSALYKVDYMRFRHENSHTGSLLWRLHQNQPHWEKPENGSIFETIPAPTGA